MFLNQPEIYKINFKTRFCWLVHFMIKLVWGLYVYFLTCFERHNYCMMDYLKLWFLDYDTIATGLSWGTSGELLHHWWKSINLRRVWLVHSTGYWRVALGFRDRSTVGFEVFYDLCIAFDGWYCFTIILKKIVFLDN